MRLHEIIGHKNTEITAPSHSQRQVSNLDSENKLGDGVRAVVHQDEDDPHMVTRYSKSHQSNYFDKFNKYAKIVVERKLWQNPHFPRIYETETELVGPPESGRAYTNWKIERLFSYETLSFDDVRAMVYNYFNEEFFREAMGMLSDQSSPDNIDEVYFERRWETAADVNRPVVAIIIEDMCEQILPIAIGTLNENNEAFEQATFILNELYTTVFKSEDDLQATNVMFRRGPGGVQMVFTDPF